MAQASAEKLEHTGPAKKERVASVPQREQLASTLEPPLPKETEPSVQSTRSWGGESQGGRGPCLGEREGDQSESMEGKGGLHRERRQIPRWKKRVSKKSFPRTSRRKHERMSGRKALQDDLQSLGFTPSLVKPEIGKEVGRRRARS